jgi:multicomponent K+:H+ antiporter subunit E
MILRRWLPHPVGSLFLALVWLLLTGSYDLGALVIGLALGLLLPALLWRLWPGGVRLRRPQRLLWLMLVVLFDIVVANISVARLVLGRNAALRPQFMRMRSRLEEPLAITILANTISLTPGTVSVQVEPDGRTLVIHGLDVDDPAKVLATIRRRYEAPLLESFSCSPSPSS